MTATQAVSSMLAALTGAVTASRLGIAGTLIGAAFMSLASTVGSAIYKHYITSSNARLRAAAATFAPRASHSAVAEAMARHKPDGAETQIIGTIRLNGDAASAPTQAFSRDRGGRTGLGRDAPTAWKRGPATTVSDAPGAWAGGAADTVRDAPTAWAGGPDDMVRDVAAAGPGGPQGGSAGEAGSAGRGTDAGWMWPWSRRRWAMVAATALAVFVISMGVVTAFEALAGKPLDAVVWHQHGSGTTVGGLVGGSGGHHPSPSTSPSPSHSPGSSHSARPSQSASSSSSPTPTTTSPTPTPSGSPSPSSSTTGGSSPATTNSPPAAQSASPGASSPSP